VHDDVAKSITVMELQRAKEEWMCHTLHELYDEMELWEWDSVQHNRWARALKASNQVKVRPMWYIEDTEQEGKKLESTRVCIHTHGASMKLVDGFCSGQVGGLRYCTDCTLCSHGMLYRGGNGDLGVVGGGRWRVYVRPCYVPSALCVCVCVAFRSSERCVCMCM
jgi:hypothetical protein